MELRIRDKHEFIDTDFGQWLIQRIRLKLVSNIRKYNFTNWDKFLNESNYISKLYKRQYTVDDIIVFAANNIVCTGIDGDISIHFNNTKFIPGFDRLKLDVVIKLINYGNLEIKGCPIFTDTFKFFARDIDTYVGLYYEV